MKKFLLSASVAAMATSAWAVDLVHPAAEDPIGEDITPASFNYNTYEKGFQGFITGTGADWNLPNHWMLDNVLNGSIEYGDGLAVATASGAASDGITKTLNESVSVVDFGGTLGKVLVMDFSGEKFQPAFKEATGYEIETIQKGGHDYYTLYWLFDAQRIAPIADASLKNLRARITCNVYRSVVPGNMSFKVFANDDENNPRNDSHTAEGIGISPSEFVYTWSEKDPETPDDAAIWEEGPGGVDGTWNPYRWLVYEFDFSASSNDGKDYKEYAFCPKLKLEFPGEWTEGTGSTLLIRSIELFHHDGTATDAAPSTRKRTWKTFTIDPTSAGIAAIGAELPEVTYTTNGNEVTFSADAVIYTISGAQVANAVAGQPVVLKPGFYVANAAGKGVKFSVK